MAETTSISWTDSTFNPWLGCQRVSPGCERCYAETLVTGRMGFPVWGPPSTTSRKRTSPANWRGPVKWNREAEAAGVRRRVFCASLADVFEDHPMVRPWREDLFHISEGTPALDWQLLTKRPENFKRFLPPSWIEAPRPNVWLGVTAEDQERANERIPVLLATPAAVRWVSAEPLLGPIDFERIRFATGGGRPAEANALTGRGWYESWTTALVDIEDSSVDWIIVGGESGPKARLYDLAWARSILRQCANAGVAAVHKQLGSRPMNSDHATHPLPVPVVRDRKGGDPTEWPEDLRIREFPRIATEASRAG